MCTHETFFLAKYTWGHVSGTAVKITPGVSFLMPAPGPVIYIQPLV